MQTSPSHTGPSTLLVALAPTSAATPGATDPTSGFPAGLSFLEHLGRSTAAGAALLESALAEAAALQPAPDFATAAGFAAARFASGTARIEPAPTSEPTAQATDTDPTAGAGAMADFADLHGLLAQLLPSAPSAAALPPTAPTEPAQARGAPLEAAGGGRAAPRDAVAAGGAAARLDAPPPDSGHRTARGTDPAARLGVASDLVVQQTFDEAAACAATPAITSTTTAATVAASLPPRAAATAAPRTPSGTEPAVSHKGSGVARPGDADANANAQPKRADRSDGSSADADLSAAIASATPTAAAAQAPSMADARAVGDVQHQDPRTETNIASLASPPQALLTAVSPPWAGAAPNTESSLPSGRTGNNAEPGRTTAAALSSAASRAASDAARAALGQRSGEPIGEHTGERSERVGARSGERAAERIDEFSGAASHERTGNAPGRGLARVDFDADAPSPTPWSMAPALTGAAPAEAPRMNGAADSASPLAAQALAGALPAAALAAPGAAALHIEFAAPVQDPRFSEAFALQVSNLARDGVQHAVLRLNPAEMGPISVQIALDGQQAQIHFGCDSAQTRGIVESGLPLLAASLREAGLTLSGGGVSQHAPEQRQESNPSGAQPERRFSAEPDRSASARTLRVSAGRLDTYA